MINYILQVILFQVLFLAIYDFFLSKETFFTKNRWYLLSTPALSFIIPLIKIPTFQKAVPQEYIVYLPEIVLSPEKVIQQTFLETDFSQSVNYINILFWVGVVIFSIVFFFKLIKIINLIRNNEVVKKSGFILILLPKQTKAFSFFKYIFLGKEIKENQVEKVIQHELVHSKQKHSLDLLFFEFLKIVMWFNPMIYFYQKRITLLHEYISDAAVAKTETKDNYINNLLSNFFQVENISFVNQFCKKSFIKKRILMITKNKSKKTNQLKYLILIPVLASMLFYISCSEVEIDTQINNKFTPKKSTQITYFQLGNEVITGIKDTESYLDSYIGNGIPEGIEVTYDDLNSFEREEFDITYERLKINENADENIVSKLKLFKKENYRITLAVIIDLTKRKYNLPKPKKLSDGSYSVLQTQKTPVFPGCDKTKRDLDCFFDKLQNHFVKNFNLKKANSLGLNSGRKKVQVSFNIDLQGKVADIEIKAPHKVIKELTLNVLNSLPTMTVGENNGLPIKVKYTLPFAFYID